MMKTAKTGRFAEVSWIVTAMLICLVPPLGMIPLGIRALLERKLHDPQRDLILGPAIGVLLFSLVELVMLTAIFWDSGEFAPMLVFVPGILWSVLMLVLRRVWRERDAKERLARIVIFRGHVTDLDKIGECLGMTSEKTAGYLEELIRSGVLKGCTVDRGGKRLAVDAPWASVRYQCPFCGGDQIVDLGAQLTCKYCDSAIDVR